MKDPCTKVTMDNVFEITRAAVMFQIPQLTKKCTEYLMSRITPENCLRLVHLAEICGLQSLYNKAKKYSLWFFTKVKQHGNFHSRFTIVVFTPHAKCLFGMAVIIIQILC